MLGRPSVGIHDNFFDLGGHSLLATQVIARIRTLTGRDVPLKELFDAPTVAALAERLGGLAAGEAVPAAAAPVILARVQEAELSFAQQRLWFIDQLEPGSPDYNIPAALKMRGALDVLALERTFVELVRRHHVLRTVFRVSEGRAVQVITPASSFKAEVQDLRALPEAARESEARRLAREEASRPFELSRGPLLRVRLLVMAEREHLLLVTMHHIISDGWSISVLLKEVAALYAAFSAGQPSPLPELPIQYSDFAAWQRDWLQGETLERQLDFWRGQLEGVPSALELPTDHPRTADPRRPGAVIPVAFSSSLTEALHALCRREGATLYMGLLASWQLLLGHYSGQDDFCVGAPIAGRNPPETEGLLGFFVNTLVFRARLGGNPTFRELLGQVKASTLGAYAHQDIPFEKLVEVLQPPRQLGRTPFFQVVLSLLNTPAMKIRLPSVELEQWEVYAGTAKFDLNLGLSETPQGLVGGLEYRADLFEPDTLHRMLAHYRVLLEAVVAHPERRISELAWVTEEERQRVVCDWNATARDFPREASVPSLFEAQVERSPEAVAVEFEGQRLTYRELDQRANRLAHHLRAEGVRHGDRVALCVERSLEMVVAVLGILKAGAAYVPLEPTTPPERLAMLLEDVQASCLLTQAGLRERLGGERLATRVLLLEAPLPTSLPDTRPAMHASADDLAYVMFTSGSTGTPKGVCIPHRAVVRLVVGTDYARLGPDEVFLQLAPLAFDASTFELWGCLLHGGRLVVFDRHTPTLEELGRALDRHGVTTLWLTAALFAQMVTHQPEPLGRVRQVLAGGDVLAPGKVREHLSRAGRLVNGYGPTEGTTFTSCAVLTHPDTVGPSVSIGRPLANTQVFILDAHLRPVPVGVPGELFIGGDGLAWGYYRRPDLTASAFVPHPYSAAPGARLYRAGDLARWMPDGSLQFLGRKDAQVKLRGYRVEPAEIEAALARHASVREVAVLARGDMPGGTALVAYVVVQPGASVDPSALRDFLRRGLPEYMIPAAFVVLPALPVTRNGKLDRRALPHPDASGAGGAGREFVAPRTPTEETLARLIAEVLRKPRVGVHDNFFELGGHSLLATQLLARVRAELKTELSLRDFFTGPSVAELARRMDGAGNEAASSPPPLTRASREHALPLSFSQRRLWRLFKSSPASTAYNMAGAYRLQGALHPDALHAAIQALIDRHESLRTTFDEEAGQPVQRVAPTLRFDLPRVDLREHADAHAEVLRRIGDEARTPFDLVQGPLVRGALLRLSEDEHLLLLTKHHILSDGWSEGVLMREVGLLYAAFARGETPRLPPLAFQYPDFAVWQHTWLTGPTLEARLGYWRTVLAGAPTLLNLPLDKPRPSTRTFAGASIPVVLGTARSEALNALCLKERVTPFMALLAVYGAVLCHQSNQEEVVIGSPIANRVLPELEPLIGLFVNGIALRVDLRGGPSFRELLARMREVTLGAYAHQDIPFDLVVDALGVERLPHRTPLFQAMFALQNAPMEPVRLPDVMLLPVAEDSGSATYELSLVLSESDGQFSGTWVFNTDLFALASIERLRDAWFALLDRALSHPDEGMGASKVEPHRS
ncbi:hypothetical protein DRW03_27485 [Corallococcus sp. H22C18031201]|nr:hypothetical protein DRW03_27485 [Corallococcus sp. H22C18031201]